VLPPLPPPAAEIPPWPLAPPLVIAPPLPVIPLSCVTGLEVDGDCEHAATAAASETAYKASRRIDTEPIPSSA
jgi:hypothetical protein